MVAALDDAAVFEHQDFVGRDDGRKTVRDHERGARVAHFLEARLDLALGLGVERGGRLVEHQDARALQDHARDRDALLLAAREFQAALADRAPVAVGQRGDEIVDARAPRRLGDLVLAGAGAAIADVVADRIVEQHRVLRHDADGAAQAVLAHVAQILAVDADGAAIDVVEAEQQPRDGRFAGAARAHDRDRVARRHAKAQIVQDGAAAVVGEADMVEHDFAARHDKGRCIGLVGDLGLDREEAEHRLEIGQGLLDVAIDHAEHVQRRIKLHEIGIDHDEVADRHGARCDAVGRQQHHGDEARRHDDALPHVERGQRRLRLDRGALVSLERAIEAARLVLLVGEVFDGLVVQEAVDRLGVGLAVALVHLAPVFDAPVGDGEGEDDIEDDGDEHHQREAAGIEAPQDPAHEQDLEHGRHEIEEQVRQQELGAADAALDRARQPAGLAVEMEAQRQRMEMAERRERDAAHRVLLDLGEDDVAQLARDLRQDARNAIGDDDHHRHGDDGGDMARRQRIDRALVQHRHDDVDALGGNEERERHHHAHAQLERMARPEIGKEPAERFQLLPEPDLGFLVRQAARPPSPHDASAPSRRGNPSAIATTSTMSAAPR